MIRPGVCFTSGLLIQLKRVFGTQGTRPNRTAKVAQIVEHQLRQLTGSVNPILLHPPRHSAQLLFPLVLNRPFAQAPLQTDAPLPPVPKRPAGQGFASAADRVPSPQYTPPPQNPVHQRSVLPPVP